MTLHSHSFVRRWVGVLGLLALGSDGAHSAVAAESARFTFRTNDVIAFVGGEDVVEMQRNGYLELLLANAKPALTLRIRSLAFEGDTVFEQHRQLNFPSWEKQFEQVGATVVIAQFGQTESMSGSNALPQFVVAYGRLLDRFLGGGRRCVVMTPPRFFPVSKDGGLLPAIDARNADLTLYVRAIKGLAAERNVQVVDLFGVQPLAGGKDDYPMSRDGIHLNTYGHWIAAWFFAQQFWSATPAGRMNHITNGVELSAQDEHLRQLIIEKNRLWFDYWRPENWAFLNGDRTDQPSSHDHRDPKKRWFPEEMQKFLPLIEAKEREIWAAR